MPSISLVISTLLLASTLGRTPAPVNSGQKPPVVAAEVVPASSPIAFYEKRPEAARTPRDEFRSRQPFVGGHAEVMSLTDENELPGR